MLLLVTVVGALASFYLLLSVVPAYAVGNGWGADSAGLCTGVLMLGTVLTELATPALIGRYGYRAVFAASLVLIGLPAGWLALSSSAAAVLGACLLRGAGIGVIFVAGSALAAELASPSRRGEVLGVFGVAAGAPGIAFLPSGVWLSDHVGYRPVFLLGAAVTLLAAVGVPRLPGRQAVAPDTPPAGGPASTTPTSGGLAGLTITFGAMATAAGVLATFLPVSLSGATHKLAALALLVQSCLTPLVRWAASRCPDRYHRPLLVAGVAASSAGVLGLVSAGHWPVLIAAVSLFGAGFGAVQHVTLTAMFARVPTSGFRKVSMLWNLAFDAGMGIGAATFGALVDVTGYAAGYALLAAAMATGLPLAHLSGRTGAHRLR